jgi:AcrR family transcriptional regulator
LEGRNSTRERIIEAASALLTEGGREAVSTRAVSAAAAVQAPTIYRLFGDKRGLLDAVGSHGFAAYLHAKTSRERAEDPVEDLRRGWDLHVDFGIAHPAFYSLIYGEPRPGAEASAAREAARVLRGLVRRVAEAGRLRVGEDRAVQMIHSAGCGVTLTLIATHPDHRDLTVSALTREAILAAVTTDPPNPPHHDDADAPVSRAVALKAALPRTTALTPAEQALLTEWLDRITN